MPDTKKLPKEGLEKAKLSKKEKLENVLNNMQSIGGLLGSAVISKDGLPIASDLGDKDIDTFAAMSAAMEGAAETAVSELKQGKLNQVIIDAEKGKIITISTGDEAILVILAKPSINLGLILLELGKSAGKIADILGG